MLTSPGQVPVPVPVPRPTFPSSLKYSRSNLRPSLTDTEDCSGSSERDLLHFHHHHHNPSKQTSTSTTAGASKSQLPLHLQHIAMQHGGPLQRRDTDAAVTDSTLFSVTSSSANPLNVSNCYSVPSSSRSASGGHNNNNNTNSRKKKKKCTTNNTASRFIKLTTSLPSIIRKRTSRKNGRGGGRKPLSETALRKKVKKSAERGDWATVRKLLSNHEFSVVPEVMPKRGSFNPEVIQEEPPPSASSDRRPSYGSRNGGQRGSFTRESAAAAAVIKAAMLEDMDGSDSATGENHGGELNNGTNSQHYQAERRPDVGENILHDVCRVRDLPLDVLETLLAALRHRRGCTSGTDDHGRTPLHLAAQAEASPELIDALIRADPTPASMGDGDKRSPLHIVVRCLAYPELPLHYGRINNQKHSSKRNNNNDHPLPSTREEVLDKTLKTIKLLKDAMLAHPGRVDFKDEDGAGYSPLDYAIDGNIQNEELIQTLIRRKEPRVRRISQRAQMVNTRNSFNRNCARSVYSRASSATEDQDIEILKQLEQVEIEARVHKIENIRALRLKERMNDALFDVFGIEEQEPLPTKVVTPCHLPPVEDHHQHHHEHEQANIDIAMEQQPSSPSPSKPLKTPEEEEPISKVPTTQGKESPAMTEDDIFNQHLADYEYLCMDDFEGDLEYADEDGFNIFDDPDELDETTPQIAPQHEMENVQIELDCYSFNAMDALPSEISAVDDDCLSVMSEVTVSFGSLDRNNSSQ